MSISHWGIDEVLLSKPNADYDDLIDSQYLFWGV